MGSIHQSEVSSLTTTTLVPIPQKKILALEHPCIIRNLDRGVKSLGGHQQINRLLELEQHVESSSFPIKLRPEDLYAAPMPSKLMITSNILLKFTVPKRTGRKRKRGTDEPFENYAPNRPAPNLHDGMDGYRAIRDNTGRIQSSVVGIIKHTHRYRTNSQFQYAASVNQFMQQVKHKLLSSDFNEMKEFTIDPAQVLRLDQEIQPPPVMQLTEVPFPYSYRQNASVKVFQDPTGVDVSINSAKPGRIVHCIMEYDVDEVPAVISPDLTPEVDLDHKLRRIINILRTGLCDRPIMSTRYQFYLTGEPMFGVLRKALPYCGYMFRGGPFKDSLIKFGVDPRKDPKYRGYQVAQVQLLGTDRTLRRYGTEPEVKDRLKPQTYVFDGKEVWTDFKVYHFCDVTDPALRYILDNASVRDEFESFAFGWYKSGSWAAFRVLLKDRIERLVKGNPKPNEWYIDMLRNIPDDISDLTELSRGGRQPPGTDAEKQALLARIRGVARTTRGHVEQDKERRAKKLQGSKPGTAGEDEADEDLDEEFEEEELDNNDLQNVGRSNHDHEDSGD